MNYTCELANIEDLDTILNLYSERTQWFKENEIKQWSKYLQNHPKQEFIEAIDIPCLEICAGQNSIIRALEGTTFEITNPEKHNQPNEDYVHKIFIDTISKFYPIVNKQEIMVNSRHKRSINQCPLLDKVGFCEDKYADIVEAKNKKFYIGVRFHPESLYKIDEDINHLFQYFIETCKN